MQAEVPEVVSHEDVEHLYHCAAASELGVWGLEFQALVARNCLNQVRSDLIQQAADEWLGRVYVDCHSNQQGGEVRGYEGMVDDLRPADVHSSSFVESKIAREVLEYSKGMRHELARKAVAEEQAECRMALWMTVGIAVETVVVVDMEDRVVHSFDLLQNPSLSEVTRDCYAGAHTAVVVEEGGGGT